MHGMHRGVFKALQLFLDLSAGANSNSRHFAMSIIDKRIFVILKRLFSVSQPVGHSEVFDWATELYLDI